MLSRSLLMNSAAILLIASAAKAADAPVTMVEPEPEPVDYVRVCDTYGTGFFYIPGTETCFKFGGYIRARINVSGDISGAAGAFGTPGDTDLDNGPFDRDYDLNTQIRARLEFDTREETELGTLRGFVRLQATNISGSDFGYGTSANNVDLDQGFIQIGGLTMGRLDSLWAENDGLYLDNDWSVGDLANNQIRYTFETNGFALSASVEDEGDGDAIPDVVAQILYKSTWGSAYISGIWDEDNYDPNPTYDPLAFDALTDIYPLDPYRDHEKDGGAFAIKAGVELKDLIFSGGSVKVEGHYATEPTEYASLAPGGYLLGIEAEGNTTTNFSVVSLPEEWQIGAGFQQTFGKVTAYVSGIYGETFDIAYLNGANDKSELWGIGGSLGYQLTSNASVLGEVTYRDVDLKGGLEDLGQTRGFLQFLREF